MGHKSLMQSGTNMTVMKYSDLSQEVKNYLTDKKHDLINHQINNSYEILRYNEKGTRYFRARRISISYQDKGNYMPFGGGSEWKIYYGEVQFHAYKNPCGETEYELVNGKRYSVTKNGTIIPLKVNTKKEVLDILEKIQIFNK